MHTVYVLISIKDGKRYIGCTSNFEKRLKEHKLGKVRSTKNRRPLKFIYREEFGAKRAAYKREKYFKTAAGRRFLDSKFS